MSSQEMSNYIKVKILTKQHYNGYHFIRKLYQIVKERIISICFRIASLHTTTFMEKIVIKLFYLSYVNKFLTIVVRKLWIIMVKIAVTIWPLSLFGLIIVTQEQLDLKQEAQSKVRVAFRRLRDRSVDCSRKWRLTFEC